MGGLWDSIGGSPCHEGFPSATVPEDRLVNSLFLGHGLPRSPIEALTSLSIGLVDSLRSSRGCRRGRRRAELGGKRQGAPPTTYATMASDQHPPAPLTPGLRPQSSSLAVRSGPMPGQTTRRRTAPEGCEPRVGVPCSHPGKAPSKALPLRLSFEKRHKAGASLRNSNTQTRNVVPSTAVRQQRMIASSAVFLAGRRRPA